jgi:hypothetical protein
VTVAVEAAEQAPVLCGCLVFADGEWGWRRYLGGSKPRIRGFERVLQKLFMGYSGDYLAVISVFENWDCTNTEITAI